MITTEHYVQTENKVSPRKFLPVNRSWYWSKDEEFEQALSLSYCSIYGLGIAGTIETSGDSTAIEENRQVSIKNNASNFCSLQIAFGSFSS